MERDLVIRYDGKYFGEIVFFYNGYYYGNVLANRKFEKTVTFDGVTGICLERAYTIDKKFTHPKIELDHLEALDRTYVFDLFAEEIIMDKLDVRNFNIYYGDHLPFSRLLYSSEGYVLGTTSIIVDSRKQTKVFNFEPHIKELEHIKQNRKVPFTKINNQILMGFWDGDIKNLYPDSGYYIQIVP